MSIFGGGGGFNDFGGGSASIQTFSSSSGGFMNGGTFDHDCYIYVIICYLFSNAVIQSL